MRIQLHNKKAILLTVFGLFLSLKGFAVETCKVGELYFDLYNSGGNLTATVSRCRDGQYSGDIVIPEKVTYNGASYTVNKIAIYAFSSNREVTSILIPNTVTEIGQGAFGYCKGLKSLTIPSSVTTIEKNCFQYCTLEPLTIEGKLNSYSGVFTDLDLSSIVLCQESEVSRIKNFFKGEVHKIGSMKEYDQDGIRYLAFTDTGNATVIGPTAPDYILGEVAIPSIVEIDGVSCRVTKIKSDAFFGYGELSSVTLGDNISEVGDYAFSGCLHLVEAKLSSAMKTIPKGMFMSCGSLASIIIPNGITEIKDDAFAECGMLGYKEALRLPYSMSKISVDAFTGCRNLKNIEVNENNSSYSSIDGVLYNRYQTKLILCPQMNTTGTFTVPNSVYEIGANAFKACVGITSIKMSDYVGSIGDFAFSGCYNMLSIQLSPNIGSIGAGAFWGCKGLKTILLPRSLDRTGGGCVCGMQITSCSHSWTS